MARIKNLSGQRFGRLIAITYDHDKRSGSGGILWNCLCDCGNDSVVRSNELVSGNTQSCGCLRLERVSEKNRKRPFESLYNTIIRHARKRGIDEILSYDEFVLLTEITECYYCNKPIIWIKYGAGGLKEKRMMYNLDRVDNNKGYSLNNVVVCCGECNRGKGNQYTQGEWACMAKALQEYRIRLAP